MKARYLLFCLGIAVVMGCAAAAAQTAQTALKTLKNHKFACVKTDAEWKKILTPASYTVLRQAGTEQPNSSPLEFNHENGIYYCAGCGQPLFSSDTKFESGTGWPSFFKPISKDAVLTVEDGSLGMERTEVVCSKCGGHLGHVFDDGPQPTGLRYCMNGVALKFKKKG